MLVLLSQVPAWAVPPTAEEMERLCPIVDDLVEGDSRLPAEVTLEELVEACRRETAGSQPPAEPKPEPTAEQKPEPTAEQKPEPTKPEPTAEQKPEPTAEQKPEPTKPEPTKPEPTKPEPTKPEPTAEQKPEPTAEQKPEPTAKPERQAEPERAPQAMRAPQPVTASTPPAAPADESARNATPTPARAAAPAPPPPAPPSVAMPARAAASAPAVARAAAAGMGRLPATPLPFRETVPMPGAAVGFGTVPPGLPPVSAGHVPEFGMLGDRAGQGPSDSAAAGSATVLPARPDGLATPVVVATLVLAGVFAALIRSVLGSRPRRRDLF